MIGLRLSHINAPRMTKDQRERMAQTVLISGMEHMARFEGAPTSWESRIRRAGMADILTARYVRQGRSDEHIARMRATIAPDYSILPQE